MVIQTQDLTIAESETFVALPENVDRVFELIGGDIVEVPSRLFSSSIATTISFRIKLYLCETLQFGHITSEGVV